MWIHCVVSWAAKTKETETLLYNPGKVLGETTRVEKTINSSLKKTFAKGTFSISFVISYYQNKIWGKNNTSTHGRKPSTLFLRIKAVKSDKY